MKKYLQNIAYDNDPTQSAYLCISGKIRSSFWIFYQKFRHIRHDRPFIWLVHVNICANKYEMYYRSGTDGRCAEQTLREHSPGGSTFLREMNAWPPSWIMMSNWKSDSIYRCVITWRKILPNFTTIRFETTEIFWRDQPNKKKKKNNKKNKKSDDMRSVPDLKIHSILQSTSSALSSPSSFSSLSS